VNPEVPGCFLAPDFDDECARLRRDNPVAQYAPHRYTVTRYADVRDVSRDPTTYCSSRGALVVDPARGSEPMPGSILHMDPPQHGPWRKVISRRFTPRAVTEWEGMVRRVTREVLDGIARGETVDFVDRVAAPIPVMVIAEVLGVDPADHEDFRRWSDATIESPDHPGDRVDDIAALYRFLVDLVRDRRANPRDDIVSALVTAEVEGEPMSTPAAVTYVMSLLIAGNETTRHLLSGTALALSQFPQAREALVADRSLVRGAVEECLRWVTPVQAFARTVTRPTELGGTDLEPDDIVVLLYASANRDESVYGPTASTFDVTRPVDTSHLAFGFGEHLCLGAALARLEGEVVLGELLARFPGLSVEGEPEWIASTLVRGMTSLPVVCA
jgi:cytochrome P450